MGEQKIDTSRSVLEVDFARIDHALRDPELSARLRALLIRCEAFDVESWQALRAERDALQAQLREAQDRINEIREDCERRLAIRQERIAELERGRDDFFSRFWEIIGERGRDKDPMGIEDPADRLERVITELERENAAIKADSERIEASLLEQQDASSADKMDRIRELERENASLKPPRGHEGTTHWEGCWRARKHHDCAVEYAERLERENAELKGWDAEGP